MKTMSMRRRLCALTAFCAVLAVGCETSDPTSYEEGGLEYEASDSGWTLASARDASGAVTVPAAVRGSPVTAIAEGAFRGSSITSVVVPSSVTSLGIHLFQDCASLATAELRASVTSLPDCLFYNCPALVSVTLPDGVVALGENVFSDCPKLASLDLGDELASMGYYAIFKCDALTSLTLPATLATMSNYSIVLCSSLSELIMLGETPPAILPMENVTTPVGVTNCDALAHMYVPSSAAVTAYKAASGWSSFGSKISVKPE